MQKMKDYCEADLYRSTNMLVNLEIYENRLFTSKDFSSQCKQGDYLQNFMYSAGQQRECDPIAMVDHLRHCETAADLEFLSEVNKEYAQLGGNEMLDLLQHHTVYDDDKKGRKYINVDDGFTASRPNDDVETIYDEVTGETKVKLWAHEYTIDPKCELTTDMNCEAEKDEETVNTSEDNIMTGNEPRAKMSPEYNNEKFCKRFPKSIESVDNSFAPAVHECITKTDSRAGCCATFERELSEGMQRTKYHPCMKNKTCKIMKRSRFSFPVIANQVSRATDRTTASEYCIDSNTDVNNLISDGQWTNYEQMHHAPSAYRKLHSHTPEQWLRYLAGTTNVNAISYEHKTVQNAVDIRILRDETPAVGIYPCVDTCPARTSPLSNHPNKVWTQANCILKSDQSDKVRVEQVSSSKHQTSYCTAFSQISRDVALYAENYDIGTKPSATCHSKTHYMETKECKHKKKLKRGCRLWEYIRNLLLDPCTNPSLIKWVDRNEGTFKLVENKRIAYNWGMKKGNGDMSYEKLSRAMRYYYKKKIFEPVIGKRLVYKFGPCATGWKD